MHKTKWLTTVVSVCFVGLLLFGSITTPATAQSDQFPDYNNTYVVDFQYGEDEWQLGGSTEFRGDIIAIPPDSSDARWIEKQFGPGNGSFIIEGTFEVPSSGSGFAYAGIKGQSSNQVFEIKWQSDKTADLTLSDTNTIKDISPYENGTNHFKIEYTEGDTTVRAKVWNDSESEPGWETSADYSGGLKFDDGVLRFGNTMDNTANATSLAFGTDFAFVTDTLVTGTVYNSRGEPISNAIVNASNGTDYVKKQTDAQGVYSFTNLTTGEWNITATAPDYIGKRKTINLTGTTKETVDFYLDPQGDAFTFNAPGYMKHGTTAKYTASGKVAGDFKNVTENISVSTDSPGVVRVYESRNELEATSNRSVDAVANISVDWTNPQTGETISTVHKVVVANETVDNVDILPPMQKFSASIGGGTDENPNDRTVVLIIVVTAIGAAVSLIATSLAGIAVMPILYTGAWVAGVTQIEIATMSVLVALFIGLNIAANIDYAVSG